MSRVPCTFLLACLSALLCACPSQARRNEGQRRETSTTAEPNDAGLTDAGDTGSGLTAAGALEIFLEAARTNLERPYPASEPDSRDRYAEAARLLIDEEPQKKAALLVLQVLASSKDDRAPRALVDWASSPAISPANLRDALRVMSQHPRAVYVEAARAVLAAEHRAGDVEVGNFGAFCELLQSPAHMPVYVNALALLKALPGEGRDQLRRIAEDRSASAPNPRVLAAVKCEKGYSRIELEAKAIASLRIMALSVLEDTTLMETIARDPKEPALVRHWARRMAKGWTEDESQMDERQKRIFRSIMRNDTERNGGFIEMKPSDTIPCW